MLKENTLKKKDCLHVHLICQFSRDFQCQQYGKPYEHEPLSVNVKFTVLLKNQVEWIIPAVFNWQHLYANW